MELFEMFTKLESSYSILKYLKGEYGEDDIDIFYWDKKIDELKTKKNETLTELCDRLRYNIYMKSYAGEWNNKEETKKLLMKKNSHNEKPPKASFVLEVIHSDIIGPINNRKSWSFLLKSKFEATDTIIEVFYNPENNGLVKRFNQTLISHTITILYRIALIKTKPKYSPNTHKRIFLGFIIEIYCLENMPSNLKLTNRNKNEFGNPNFFQFYFNFTNNIKTFYKIPDDSSYYSSAVSSTDIINGNENNNESNRILNKKDEIESSNKISNLDIKKNDNKDITENSENLKNNKIFHHKNFLNNKNENQIIQLTIKKFRKYRRTNLTKAMDDELCNLYDNRIMTFVKSMFLKATLRDNIRLCESKHQCFVNIPMP
ncbi:hypothetical protein H8356DRAFT_1356950 [Neocallimastix lanati (nom. inval.)]|nr:hypothetical protein H8356DRAFT_1356950 [Neocallimastix sp. JGI-2020a]